MGVRARVLRADVGVACAGVGVDVYFLSFFFAIISKVLENQKSLKNVKKTFQNSSAVFSF